uniref:SCP domain-containing protein n=1 Tax=Panagrolaimus sp. ES5 TaxID=591445 RepID=A0AC34F481_9BILA
MFAIQPFIIFGIFLFASSSMAQLIGTSCSNPNLLMTPTLRKQVLSYINLARSNLKAGQLLLANNEYALQPITMRRLTWSCEVEEDMHEIAGEVCQTGILTFDNVTWQNNAADLSHAELVSGGLNILDIAMQYQNYLSEHTIYTGTASSAMISFLHDKAETAACAIRDCLHSSGSFTSNYLYCKITPDVQFGEKVYEVSPNAVANWPSEDVICPEVYGLEIATRQMILEKVNAVRRKIQQGTYFLQNSLPALQAVNMTDLVSLNCP